MKGELENLSCDKFFRDSGFLCICKMEEVEVGKDDVSFEIKASHGVGVSSFIYATVVFCA